MTHVPDENAQTLSRQNAQRQMVAVLPEKSATRLSRCDTRARGRLAGIRVATADHPAGQPAFVSSPTLQATGLELRIVKEGTGRAIVDEISLRESYAPEAGGL